MPRRKPRARRPRPTFPARQHITGPRDPWWRPRVHVEVLMVGLSVYFAAACNVALFGDVSSNGAFGGVGGWTLAVCLFLAIAATHALMLSVVPGRVFAKIVFSALLLGAASVSSLASSLIDPVDVEMLRGILTGATSIPSHWLSPTTVAQIGLWAGLPIAAVWWIRLSPRSWPVAAMLRTLFVVAASVVFVTGVKLPGHTVWRLRQDHPELSQQVTPLNLVVAAFRSVLGAASVPSDDPKSDAPPPRASGVNGTALSPRSLRRTPMPPPPVAAWRGSSATRVSRRARRRAFALFPLAATRHWSPHG